MAQVHFTLDSEEVKSLFLGNRDEAMAKVLQIILNHLLEAEATEQIGAQSYERSDDRTTYRNGIRERELTTRIGTITLAVPRLRNGNFHTEIFQRYQRSEQALIMTMLQMVVDGVSTRKVENVTRELCGTSFSKSTVSALCSRLDPVVEAFRNRPLLKHYPFVIVDALYLKVRENHAVRSKGFLVAIGINEEGKPEILGFLADDSESEETWCRFFHSLKQRGLSRVDLITSDNHGGLVNAVKKSFQGTVWQRCQTHFSKNVLDNTPKSLRGEVKTFLRDIYTAPDRESAKERMQQLSAQLTDRAPKAKKVLEDGFDDAIAAFMLPEKYRKRMRTSNYIERLNEELRRRERVIRIFPNTDSVYRLLGAVLMEQHEKWSGGKKYLDMDEYYAKRVQTNNTPIVPESWSV